MKQVTFRHSIIMLVILIILYAIMFLNSNSAIASNEIKKNINISKSEETKPEKSKHQDELFQELLNAILKKGTIQDNLDYKQEGYGIYKEGIHIIRILEGKNISTLYITMTAIPKDRGERTSTDLIMYRVKNKTNEFVRAYEKVLNYPTFVSFEALRENLFMINWLAPIGRTKTSVVYYDTGDTVKEVMMDDFDIMEFAYYEGYEAPHLFLSTIAFSENKINSNVVETRVYQWDKTEKKYILLKKFNYNNKVLWKDRFQLIDIEGKTPQFGPMPMFEK